MTLPLDAFLPSLAVLGLWSYWALGLAAFLEAFVPTGLFMPGTLIVEAGGILVQQGLLDYLDLVWFVAAGAILGGEASYSLGRLARRIPGEAILAWMPLIAMEACRDLRRRVFGCLAAAPAGRRPAACGRTGPISASAETGPVGSPLAPRSGFQNGCALSDARRRSARCGQPPLRPTSPRFRRSGARSARPRHCPDRAGRR